MTAILRNNAAATAQSGAQAGVGKATLKGGGSGRAPMAQSLGAVKPKGRYSEDPAAELMPAAEFLGFETDYDAILEGYQDSPFDPARRKVLGRLMGMFAMDYQGAGKEERAFLRRLLNARNAREGYAANRALHLVLIPEFIRRTLALGVAEARFEDGKIIGFLSAVQARMAATTFKLLGPKAREALWNALTLAGHDEQRRPYKGADVVLERAITLKALGARRHQLGPWSPTGQRAINEVVELSAEIRGLTRKALAARTTLQDGDKKRVSPGLLLHKSAGARALYLSQGEIDPLFAWQEHGRKRETLGVLKSGISSGSKDDILPNLDRSPLLDRVRLHQAFAEAKLLYPDWLSDRPANALKAWVAGKDLSEARTEAKNEALRALKKRGFDILRISSLEAIRNDSRGIYKFDAARGLSDLLSRFTGAVYIRRLFSDQLTAGADPLRQIRIALDRGLAVPVALRELRIAVSRPLVALAARGEGPEAVFDLQFASTGDVLIVPAQMLLAPVLPADFGQRTRADAYMAPAALDLLAPPFGLPFPDLGILDLL